MKFTLTYLGLLGCLFLLPALLSAQSYDDGYAENEFVVVYDHVATDIDHLNLRTLYGVTNFESLFGGYVEIWRNLAFPITVHHDDGPVTLLNVDELELDINLSGLGDSDPRARVSDGDFNYEITLDDDSAGWNLEESDNSPLLYCADNNYRVLGNPRQTNGDVHIVVFDQVLSHSGLHTSDITTHILTDNPGGTHANKVAWIIDDVLHQEGVHHASITNFGVFGADGTASYVDLLVGFHTLQALDIRNAIVNFSANLNFTERDIIDGNLLTRMAAEIVQEQNLLLISSAGNDAHNGSNVFPGCFELPNEITVVGTGRCFTQLSSFTNTNGMHYEIAAEAESILTDDGTVASLVNGTSYAAPLVTAAAAQVSMSFPEFSAEAIRGTLLASADSEPALGGAVNNNRVLNTSSACLSNDPLRGKADWSSTNAVDRTRSNFPSDFQVAPNPFTTEVTLQLPEGWELSACQVSIIGIDGRIWRSSQTLYEPTVRLADLPRGLYLLVVEKGAERRQRRIVKQ